MTPAKKSTAILAAAATLSGLTLFLSHASTGRAPSPAPKNAAGMKLAPQLLSSHVLQGTHTTYMAVSLDAPQQVHTRRPDVDLAIVLDRSGSMEGEKLVHAKSAAQQLIQNLEPDDRFSLTAYGSDVDIIFPNIRATAMAKADAYRAIESIYTDGGTNLSGGLMSGRSQLQSLDEVSGRVQRIVLISDGQANEGIVDRNELSQLSSQTADSGISITTVGVGLDFDEQTMTRIAVSGRGNYYFAESAEMLAGLFDTELSRLGATVATNMTLRFTPKAGVVVKEFLGYDAHREGDAWIVPVADMHAGEQRKVVVALEVDAKGTGSMDIAEVSTTFSKPKSGETARLTSTLKAEITTDQAVVEKNRDKLANRLIERAKTAAAIEEATALYEAGERDKAVRLMEKRSQAAQSIANELGDDEFAAEMTRTEGKINSGFAAPASSSKGKKARKANRSDAYQLMY